ncbi:hypothetical protein U1Q18_019842 [Sarracenia purpurea var. burkii]
MHQPTHPDDLLSPNIVTSSVGHDIAAVLSLSGSDAPSPPPQTNDIALWGSIWHAYLPWVMSHCFGFFENKLQIFRWVLLRRSDGVSMLSGFFATRNINAFPALDSVEDLRIHSISGVGVLFLT